MEPGELLAAYVCVGVGGFLLIIVIVMLTVLIFTGKCDFCRCNSTEEDRDHVGDQIKLKYKVEHEMQRNHNNNDVVQNGSLRYHSGGKFIASSYRSSSLPGSTKSADPPTRKRRKRKDQYNRVKRQKQPRSRLERDHLRSSSSSQEFSDSRQKPYTLHVTQSKDDIDGDLTYPYAYIDRKGRRYRMVSNNAPVQMRREKTLRRSDHIKSGSSTDGSLPPSRASSVRYGGKALSTRTTGSDYSSAPQLVAAHNGIILKDPTSNKGQGPIIIRWSPSMKGKARRYYTPSTATSRPSSRHSSNAYTLDGSQTTAASSRRTVSDFRL